MVPGAHLEPNPWNPNKMNAFMYAKAMESLREFGFVQPILARQLAADRWQIIDGEHRWRVGTDLGYGDFPVFRHDCDDAEAKRLTVILNELHGQADPGKLGALLADLSTILPPAELAVAMPFTDDVLRGLVDLPDLSTMPPPPSIPPAAAGAAPPQADVWVERLYRMPASAAAVLDDALARAKDGDEIDAWQALERIAAEFLAS